MISWLRFHTILHTSLFSSWKLQLSPSPLGDLPVTTTDNLPASQHPGLWVLRFLPPSSARNRNLLLRETSVFWYSPLCCALRALPGLPACGENVNASSLSGSASQTGSRPSKSSTNPSERSMPTGVGGRDGGRRCAAVRKL